MNALARIALGSTVFEPDHNVIAVAHTGQISIKSGVVIVNIAGAPRDNGRIINSGIGTLAVAIRNLVTVA